MKSLQKQPSKQLSNESIPLFPVSKGIFLGASCLQLRLLIHTKLKKEKNV